MKATNRSLLRLKKNSSFVNLIDSSPKTQFELSCHNSLWAHECNLNLLEYKLNIEESKVKSNMVRICYTAGIDIKVSEKDGQLILQGPAVESQRATIEFVLRFGNLSQFLLRRTKDDCTETFLRNESDFSTGLYYLHDESVNYSVPVPIYPTSLTFLTGYDVFEYESKQKVNGMTFDVLKNFASYCLPIYGLTFIWIVTLLLFIFVRFSIHRIESRTFRRWKKSFRVLYLVTIRGSKNWRWLMFILSIGFFLVTTPFFILFKTNQVVIEQPFIFTSFKEIMKNNTEIVFTKIHLSVSLFLEPPDGPCLDSIMCEMWKYFNSHSREVTFDRSPKSIKLTYSILEGIISKKMIFIATHGIAESFRQVFCSFSKPPNLNQLFRMQDSHQREILVGFAFRESKPPEYLVKKLRHTFEFQISAHIVDSNANYYGFETFDWGESHRQRQLALCHQKELIEYHRKEVFASDVNFFSNFFAILLLLVFFAFAILCHELYTGRHKAVKRHPKICPGHKANSFPVTSHDTKMRRKGFMERYVSSINLY